MSELLVVTPNGYKASKLYSVVPTDGSGDLTWVRNTTATLVNSSGLIESVSANVPRLDYSGSVTCPCILVEPQRTNLLLYSEQFDNAYYTKISSSITANSTTSPDGLMTADSFIEDTSNNAHYIDVRPTVVNVNNTVSIYVKANGRNKFQLREGSFGDIETFDLANPTGNIIALSNGWFRVFLTTTPAATTFIFQLRLLDNSGNVVYTGDGTSGLFIWGSQLEQASTYSSYIPTVAASQTRNADVGTVTTPVGITSLIETYEDGTTNVISPIPVTYQMSEGRISKVVGL